MDIVSVIRFLWMSAILYGGAFCCGHAWGQLPLPGQGMPVQGDPVSYVVDQDHALAVLRDGGAAIFATIFTDTAWSPEVAWLRMDNGAGEPGSVAIGRSMAAAQEPVSVTVIFASTLDWSEYPFAPGEEDLLWSSGLECSVVAGILQGDAGICGMVGLSMSLTVGGERHHFLLPVLARSLAEAERWWPLHDAYYGLRAIQPCGAEYGDADVDFSLCEELALGDLICRTTKLRSTKRNTAWGLGVTGLLTCGTCLATANPLACGACIPTAIGAVVAVVCFENYGVGTATDFEQAMSCCCSSLKCRNEGGSDCASAAQCQGSQCPDIPSCLK